MRRLSIASLPDMWRQPANRVLSVLACLATLAAAACSSQESKQDILTAGQKLYSQGDEELIIRHFFDDREGGFFVDVGCYDWKRLSTTLYLEKHLGWSGIGVDANDGHARGYAENRPNTRFMNYIVTDHSGTEETFYLAVGAEGVSSTSERFIRDFFRAFFRGAKPTLREVTVPTITLDDVLERNGVTRIDFLSMDIEGHEPRRWPDSTSNAPGRSWWASSRRGIPRRLPPTSRSTATSGSTPTSSTTSSTGTSSRSQAPRRRESGTTTATGLPHAAERCERGTPRDGDRCQV